MHRPAESVSFSLLKRSPIEFPAAWVWLVDESIPRLVKTRYSPKESWKDKPFSQEDARFFFKGIEELSSIFTEERAKGIPTYFNHPKFRSSYLLYFLPLQAAKFLTLLQLHPGAFEAALAHAKKQGVFRLADLGAGPGTASLGVLLWLQHLSMQTGMEIPKIELTWLDTNRGSMEDGKRLVEELSENFPRLRNKITLSLYEAPWWDLPRLNPEEQSLILMGHVLNESYGPTSQKSSLLETWDKLLRKASGGGVLIVEPAARRSSQQLSQLRDQLFQVQLLEEKSSSLWGPCLHAKSCPLAEGRDWCHFSIPTMVPGNWFREFSKALGSERQWLKFSYLWIASNASPAPSASPSLRRVVSDRMGERSEVLLCEPEHPKRILAGRTALNRGDLIDLKSGAPKPKPRDR